MLHRRAALRRAQRLREAYARGGDEEEQAEEARIRDAEAERARLDADAERLRQRARVMRDHDKERSAWTRLGREDLASHTMDSVIASETQPDARDTIPVPGEEVVHTARPALARYVKMCIERRIRWIEQEPLPEDARPPSALDESNAPPGPDPDPAPRNRKRRRTATAAEGEATRGGSSSSPSEKPARPAAYAPEGGMLWDVSEFSRDAFLQRAQLQWRHAHPRHLPDPGHVCRPGECTLERLEACVYMVHTAHGCVYHACSRFCPERVAGHRPEAHHASARCMELGVAHVCKRTGELHVCGTPQCEMFAREGPDGLVCVQTGLVLSMPFRHGFVPGVGDDAAPQGMASSFSLASPNDPVARRPVVFASPGDTCRRPDGVVSVVITRPLTSSGTVDAAAAFRRLDENDLVQLPAKQFESRLRNIATGGKKPAAGTLLEECLMLFNIGRVQAYALLFSREQSAIAAAAAADARRRADTAVRNYISGVRAHENSKEHSVVFSVPMAHTLWAAEMKRRRVPSAVRVSAPVANAVVDRLAMDCFLLWHRLARLKHAPGPWSSTTSTPQTRAADYADFASAVLYLMTDGICVPHNGDAVWVVPRDRFVAGRIPEHASAKRADLVRASAYNMTWTIRRAINAAMHAADGSPYDIAVANAPIEDMMRAPEADMNELLERVFERGIAAVRAYAV